MNKQQKELAAAYRWLRAVQWGTRSHAAALRLTEKAQHRHQAQELRDRVRVSA